MKVTSFKDLEAYIYSRIVLPLKRQQIEFSEVQSPLSGEQGQWELGLYQEQITTEYRRRYQRQRALRNRNWIIGLSVDDHRATPLGEYNIKNRWVKLFEDTFKELNAMPLLGKMYETLDADSQFSKVVIQAESPYANTSSRFGEYQRVETPYLERRTPALPTIRMIGDSDMVEEEPDDDW